MRESWPLQFVESRNLLTSDNSYQSSTLEPGECGVGSLQALPIPSLPTEQYCSFRSTYVVVLPAISILAHATLAIKLMLQKPRVIHGIDSVFQKHLFSLT